MNIKPGVDDYSIGDTVKIVRLPRHDWRAKRGGMVGLIGTVKDIILPDPEDGEPGQWLDVRFGPPGTEWLMRPWWVERGRVEWIATVPDDNSLGNPVPEGIPDR